MARRRIWLPLIALVAVGQAGCAPTSDVATATPGESAQPTAVVTPTPTTAPTQPSPTAIPSPTVAPSPSAAPSPTPAAASWTLENLSDRRIEHLSMAVDAAGNVHFVGVTRKRVVYWTNASGAWTHENLGLPADGLVSDKSPQIAITESGDIVVAYERSWCFVLGCDSAVINVTLKTSTGWSAPQEVAPGVSPDLAVAGDVIGVAYEAVSGFTDVACEGPTPIEYAVLSADAWAVKQVTSDGRYPRLAFGPQGAPVVVFTNECGFLGNAGLYIAELKTNGDSFGAKPVPGTSPVETVAHAIAVDSAAGVHLLYERYNSDDEVEFVYSVRTRGGWPEPVEPLPDVSARWLSLNDTGVAHFLGDSSQEGWWHAAGSPANLVVDPVATDLHADYLAAGALALGNDGRPHVLLTAGGRRPTPFSLWYGVSGAP